MLLFTKQSCKLNIQIMVLEMKIYVNLLKSRTLVVSSDDSFLFGGLKGRKVFFRFVASFWGSFYGVKIELLEKVFWGQNMFSGRFLGSFVLLKIWISKLWLSILKSVIFFSQNAPKPQLLSDVLTEALKFSGQFLKIFALYYQTSLKILNYLAPE